MAVEVTVVMWLDGDVPVPEKEEIEEHFNCSVIEYDVEEDV